MISQILGDVPNQSDGSSRNLVGVGAFSDLQVNAVAGTAGTNLASGTAAITVSLDGAFFRRGSVGIDVIDMEGGTDVAKGFILLHELAHLTGAFGFEDNDRAEDVQGRNNVKVQVMCGRTLLRLGW